MGTPTRRSGSKSSERKTSSKQKISSQKQKKSSRSKSATKKASKTKSKSTARRSRSQTPVKKAKEEEVKRTKSGRIICKYGYRCFYLKKDEGCEFYHPRCKQGDECEFFKAGNCKFFHGKDSQERIVVDCPRSRSTSRSKSQTKQQQKNVKKIK